MSTPDLGISVVIAAYNYRQFIAEAIDSALAQSQPVLEVLVIDDGSTDGTAEFVRERYREQAKVQVHRFDNGGQLAAFMAGTKLARGEIISFLDADDRWQPRYLEKVMAVYVERPEVNFVYTNMRYFGSREGEFLNDPVSRDLGLSILLGAYAAQWQATATSALSLRRKLALELLDIPERFLPKWKTRADDWLVYGSDVLGARKYYLAEALVDYRAHGSNAWLSQDCYGIAALQHSLKVETMLAHYRHRAGLSEGIKTSVLRYAKHEFRSKPQPSFNELQQYTQLVGMSSLAWNKRLEHKVSMWRHYLKRSKAKKPSN